MEAQFAQDSNDRYCAGCGYRLVSSDRHHCPECGRHFNVHDPATFNTYSEVYSLTPTLMILGVHAVGLLITIIAVACDITYLPSKTPRWIAVTYSVSVLSVITMPLLLAICIPVRKLGVGRSTICMILCAGLSVAQALILFTGVSHSA